MTYRALSAVCRPCSAAVVRRAAILVFAAVFLVLSALPAVAGGTKLRLMAANLTSGSDQAYEEPGIRIIKAMAPDVLMIQEFNAGSNTNAAIRTLVDTMLGRSYQFYREEGTIPNGVVSRYPIKQSGSWVGTAMSNRDFAWARIDIPGEKDLWAVSVHLKASSGNPNEAARVQEAGQVAGYIQTRVPRGDYVALGGDFNAQDNQEPFFGQLAGVVVVRPPYPADSDGNPNTNSHRSKPYDWVLTNPELHVRMVPVQLGSQTFENGLVFDSREYRPLSEVAPVEPSDSSAPNMQHMGVVKDFVIPDAKR